MIQNNRKHRPNGGGRPIGVPPKAALVFLITLYHKYLWIFLIYSLYIPYIYFLSMFHIFSLVCFLIYGVKSRSGHDRRQSAGPISHASGSKPSFWCNFQMILHGFAWRSPKNIFVLSKKLISIRNGPDLKSGRMSKSI